MTDISTFAGQLPAAEGVNLFLESTFQYETLQANEAPVFRPVTRVNSKVPFVATFVGKTGYNAKPVNGLCDNSNFGKGNKSPIRKIKFEGQEYDYSGDLCGEDFANLCEAYSQGLTDRMMNPMGAFMQNQLLQVIFNYKLQEMRDDVSRIGWFARKGAFAVNTGAGTSPFYVGALPAGADTTLGGSQSGFWELAINNAINSLTPYVDVNNGITGGILNRNNVYAYLQKFIDSASPELRGVPKGTANSPFFLVDNAVFEALRDYYTMNGVNTNNTLAWQMQMENQDTLMFLGYKVYRDDNADKFDSEIDAKTTSTIGGQSVYHSLNCRVVFTVPRIAFLGFDIATPSADTIGLIIRPAVGLKRLGFIEWAMRTSIGIIIGEPNMMVVGYPSDNATWL